MKSATKGIAINQKPAKEDATSVNALQQQIENYQRERNILLDLSNDITKVRQKDDLIKVFSSRLKQYFYFTHAVISLIDKEAGTYFPFLPDKNSMHIRHRSELPSLLQMHFVIDDPFIRKVTHSEISASFLLDEIINEPRIPAFLKVNYECGIRKAMITKLKSQTETIGFVLMYSDRTDSFTDDFKYILEAITPHLSNAVATIIINEEIREKEREKSLLLSLSDAIAALRSREDLLRVVNEHIKTLFSVSEFGIAQINEGATTYSAFIMDVTDGLKSISGFKKVTSARYAVSDPLFSSILRSEEPVKLDVYHLANKPGMPDFVRFWKQAGIRQVLAMRLHVGGKNVGCAYLHIDAVKTGQIKNNLFKAVCAHLSVAVSNILANEQVSKKQQEQAFLLNFSNDLAHVRTKSDLQAAIFNVLDNTVHTKLAMLRVIEEDGFHMSAFMYDNSLFEKAKGSFDKMAANSVTVEEVYTAQVLASEDGMMFSIEEELKSGNAYAKLWKTTGFKNVYGLPLRVGNRNIGTIWLLANEMSQLLLRGICAQISVAIANIQANEKLLAYKKQLEVENDYLKEQIKTIYNFSEIIGSGDAMQKVYRLMSLVADANTTVLVLGETGTGKELIARAIHNASPRRNKLMVKVNCAALPANLIESELFGHERGAFTGAVDKRIGKFELATHSTLFLDEIGELPLEAQAKLLRIIQERELERLGGSHTIAIDVRLIAATNRNLEEEVKAGRFRADLYFRLNVFPISLPPLRDRREDVEPLAHFFIEKYSRTSGRKIRKVSPKVIQQLRSYSWPGNVRELEHLIERSILLTTDGVLDEIHIPQTMAAEKQEQAHLLNRSLEEVERNYIIETLKRCAGKISGAGSAAEVLKVPGNTLHSKMKKLGIGKCDYFN